MQEPNSSTRKVYDPSGFTHFYTALLQEIVHYGVPETNARTGHEILVQAAHSFTLDLSLGILPVCGIRRTFPRSAAAEVAWFMSGSQDVSFIREYAPLWDKFVEDDGVTIEAAYGYRWRSAFGRDQITDALHALSRNPSDRRIYISAWDPAEDGLGNPGKNVPCPVGFTLSITDGRLNSTLLIRSSDVFVGLPYDIMGHALLMKAMQRSLVVKGGLEDLRLGDMHVTLAHPHFYNVHGPLFAKAMESRHSDRSFYMPDYTVEEITAAPHAYVKKVADLAKAVDVRPEYHCVPEVVA
jgi:thymidylate synthase